MALSCPQVGKSVAPHVAHHEAVHLADVASAAGATTKGADKKDLDASRIYENLIGQEAGNLGGKVCRLELDASTSRSALG